MTDGLNLGPDWYTSDPEPANATTPETSVDTDGDLTVYDQWAAEQDDGPWDESGAPHPSDVAGSEADTGKLAGMRDAVQRQSARAHTQRGGGKDHAAASATMVDAEHVQRVVRTVVASLNKRSAEEVLSVTERLQREKAVLKLLPENWRGVLYGVLEVLAFDATALFGVGVVDFDYLPGASNYSEKVRDELETLKHTEALEHPLVTFEALVEAIQADSARRAALDLARVIERKGTAKEKMERYRNIPAPTRQRVIVHNDWAKTAAEWEDAAKTRTESSDLIFTSGHPTLDRTASGADLNPGLIKPGEFWVGASGTGHGKSAFTRRAFTAMLDDLVNGWGYRDARGVLFFTEEEAPDIIKAAGLNKGGAFHHLARNATLAKIGQSRKRMQMVIWDGVKRAEDQAMATGVDITEYMDTIAFLDYIQGVKEPGENPDTDGVANTADWLMRGLAAFDHEMMGAISGLSYQEYTGRSWPDGLGDHRVAVFCLSQLRKEGTDHNVFYRRGKSDIANFSVLNENGEPLWQPQEDDYAIPNRSDLRGSGVLLNHATGLVFFHRSKPMGPVRKNADGRIVGLVDTRARFIVAKARKAAALPYVPMRFDSQPSGFRGQFYDDLAYQHGVLEGRMEVRRRDEMQSGDPIMPVRPERSPWTVRY